MALILKRASISRTSVEWNDDDYDVLADGAVVVGQLAGRDPEEATDRAIKAW
jgi:hypothetical protein